MTNGTTPTAKTRPELPAALFQISELAHRIDDIEIFCAEVHEIVRRLVRAENLFIVIRDRQTRAIRWVYHADSVDQNQTVETLNSIPTEHLEHSLTAWAMQQGKTVHLNADQTREICAAEDIALIGSPSVDWLAVPLIWQEEVLGSMVVQSYEEAVKYGPDDEALLEYVCSHIANLLHRRWTEEALRRANDELEQRVALRTAELTEANAELERQVAERERGERLQKALFRIAQLASDPLPMEEVFGSIHQAIGDLIYARNLFIALADWDARLLRFPYHSDEREDLWDDLPIPENLDKAGPTMRILATGEPLLYIEGRHAFPKGARGERSKAWLGVPLKLQSGVIGVIAVQSYDSANAYGERDLELMLFVGRHIAITLDRRQNKLALQQAKEELEQRVRERTRALRHTNRELRGAMNRLEEAQVQLVESEKLASLGGMVAGIAHEINTPLGVALTATTHLEQRIHRALDELERGEREGLSGSEMDHLVARPVDLLLKNLRKAVELVSSFKLVTADQFTDDLRKFDLARYLGDIFTSLRPKIRDAGLQLDYQSPDELKVESYPHAFYPILSNLVLNSIIHGYGECVAQGRIDLSLRCEANDAVTMVFSDDGVGMAEDIRRKIFEPFFTTRRGHGGTGLGLHIVYNHVRKLGGTISCQSAPGQGATFTIHLPRTAPHKAASEGPWHLRRAW